MPRIIAIVVALGCALWAGAAPVRTVQRDGSTLVPLRLVAEWLGAKVASDARGAINVTRPGRVIVLTLGSEKCTVNGMAAVLPTKVVVVDGTGYVPVRMVQWLGAKVTWDEGTREISIRHSELDETLILPTKGGEQAWCEPLHLEAHSGLAARITARLAAGADANAPDSAGLTALHWAAMAGRVEAARALIAGGADVYARPRGGMQPIHLAAAYGQPEMVALLLEMGAAANAMGGSSGYAPLHCVALGPEWGLAKADPPASMAQARVATVDALLAGGARLGARDTLAGWQPLHAAAAAGDTALIEALTARGADLHARDARGRTPLIVAATCNRPAAATALLTAGADALARDADGLTALDVALRNGGQPLVAALVAGAQPVVPPDPGAEVPAEFAEGTIDGSFYLIRLKHGGASWNAYNDGLRRLLAFLDAPDAPWQDIPLLLDAATLRAVYLDKPNGVPPCLYLYADTRLALRPDEAALLRGYLARGGFLFVDGPSGPEARAHVLRELERVAPEPLAPLPADHPVYRACYALRAPAVGEDLVKRTNYGLTRGGRLVIYYTQANFTRLFSRFAPDADEYLTAQYQMAANVLAYARARGTLPEGVRRPGASPLITPAVLDLLTKPDPPAEAPAVAPGG